MKIKYHGNSCFLLKSKKSKLITNPKSEGVKVNLKKVAPDVVVLSHRADVSENGYYLISMPGEYEVKDIFAYGFISGSVVSESEYADIYMFNLDGTHLGMIDRSVKSVSEGILDEMGIVNVLFVSLASDSQMKLSKLTDLVNKIEPQIVIPMDYEKENLDNFTKALGVKEPEKVSSLDVKKTDFQEEDMPLRVVVLEK